MTLPSGFGAGMICGVLYQAFWSWYAPKLVRAFRRKTELKQ